MMLLLSQQPRRMLLAPMSHGSLISSKVPKHFSGLLYILSLDVCLYQFSWRRTASLAVPPQVLISNHCFDGYGFSTPLLGTLLTRALILQSLELTLVRSLSR